MNDRINQSLNSLKKSSFRSKFRLAQKDRDYITGKGLETIRDHAVQIVTWVLHKSEAFIGKASKGDVVVFYFEPLATQHMKTSGSPEG